MKPDARDLHIYGGLVVMGAAIEWSVWGVAVVGAALVYLGVFRMGGRPPEEER